MSSPTGPGTTNPVGAKPLPATVIKVLDRYTLVINRGSLDGVKLGARFLVFALDDEMFDPETNESLGRLEVVRGTGTVSHVQPHLATLTSDKKRRGATRRTIRRPLYGGVFGQGPDEIVETDAEEVEPFEEPKVADLAKPV